MQEEKLSTPDHPKPQHLHHFPALFRHTINPYQPRNVNKVHEEEKAAGGHQYGYRHYSHQKRWHDHMP